ncbi:hypothetical protein [Nonomuraea sp. B1E8]|uniref:hypothetical protein n=1 Tax=unclassified Nonomuraea TaxID=2593643 RepID=UPI00325DDB97
MTTPDLVLALGGGSFLGIRGIGSLFYLAYALGQARFGVPAEESGGDRLRRGGLGRPARPPRS